MNVERRTNEEDWLVFRDRADAGRVLAGHLQPYRGTDTLVMGLSRGGVPVAAEVADYLNAELDVIVVRKLGSPISPELGIGAVTADGGRYLNDELIQTLGVSESYVARVTDVEMAEARRRSERYRRLRPAPSLAGRVVIVVDDGLATGSTMMAALRSARRQGPRRLVAAVPVASLSACQLVAREADALVCPNRLEDFGAVGSHYQHFEPTTDADVEALLAEAHERVEGWRAGKGGVAM